MPKRETAPLGAPCWVDLLTSDADRSRSFYSELFGWKAEEPAPQFGGTSCSRRTLCRSPEP